MITLKGICIQCGGEYPIERGKDAAPINTKHICEACANPKPVKKEVPEVKYKKHKE